MTSPRVIIFDTETDGLFMVDRQGGDTPEGAREVSRVWMLAARVLGEQRVRLYTDEPLATDVDGPMSAGLELLHTADIVVGHNAAMYDLPVLRRLLGFVPRARCRDTLVGSRWRWPEIINTDFALHRAGGIDGKLMGRHSLKAWGFRLGLLKGNFGETSDWSRASVEMADYCRRDVEVCERLYVRLTDSARGGWDLASWDLECAFARILGLQALHGVMIDEGEAGRLASAFEAEYGPLLDECRSLFPPFKDPYTTPKKQLQRVRVTPFKPTSSDHVARALTEKYGWEPLEFTEKTHKPAISDEILSELPYPECAPIRRLMAAQRWRARLYSGPSAWLRNVRPDGTLAAVAIHNGTQTRRCAHRIVSNVPADAIDAGLREAAMFRGLFRAAPGRVLVGCDASGLELRCLAHFVSAFDGGEFARQVVSGDPHAAGMERTGIADRHTYKRVFYAWLYGAQNKTLGSIVGKGESEGARLRAAVESGGVVKVLDALWSALTQRGMAWRDARTGHWQLKRGASLRLPDGSWVEIRHAHAILNTLLQSLGAIVMKRATVLLDEAMREAGLVVWDEEMPPDAADVCQVIHYHDEFQLECRESVAPRVAELAPAAIRASGAALGLRCPMDGEAHIGVRWSETH